MTVNNSTVIIPCVNKVEGIISVVESLLESDKYGRIILLDLYSPDPKTRVYIACIAELYTHILLVDPGRKLPLSEGLDLAASKIEGEYVILKDYKKDEHKIQESVQTQVVPKATSNPFQFRRNTKRTKSFIAPGRFKGGNSI